MNLPPQDTRHPLIRIGISSCLLGHNVRYDGGNKLNTYINEQLSRFFEFVPYCPEVAIDMGIPRPPIQLVEVNDGIHAQGIDDPSMDMTIPLSEYGRLAARGMGELAGYIFKRNSPSCGIAEVKLLTRDKAIELRGRGLFAAEVMRHWPDLPVIDEQQLADESMRTDFVTRVQIYHAIISQNNPPA